MDSPGVHILSTRYIHELWDFVHSVSWTVWNTRWIKAAFVYFASNGWRCIWISTCFRCVTCITRKPGKGATGDVKRFLGTHTPESVDYYHDVPIGNKRGFTRVRCDHRRTCMVCRNLTGAICSECNARLCIRSSAVENCWKDYHEKEFWSNLQ